MRDCAQFWRRGDKIGVVKSNVTVMKPKEFLAILKNATANTRWLIYEIGVAMIDEEGNH